MILRHEVDIMSEQVVNSGAMGDEKEWVAVEECVPCLVRLENLDGRAKYQQIGHSTVTNSVVFRDVDLTMDHKLKWGDQWLEIIESPGNPDGVGRYVTVLVRPWEPTL